MYRHLLVVFHSYLNKYLTPILAVYNLDFPLLPEKIPHPNSFTFLSSRRSQEKMKLTLTLVTLLPLLAEARPYKPKKLDHKPWSYKIAFVNAKSHLVSHSQEKREQQRYTSDIQQSPDYSRQPPLPWPPKHSHLGSPYLPQGGLSIMTDNMPSDGGAESCVDGWLECGSCPGDARCWRYKPPPADDVNEDETMDAITDPDTDLYSPSTSACPLGKCRSNSPLGPWPCGANAECVVDHCVCARGFKGSKGWSVRGYSGLQALTVWVDAGVDCSVSCDELSCAEVEQVDVCFQRIENGVVVMPGGDDDSEGGESK